MGIVKPTKQEYFLAGGGLTWIYVAGSITLTNLSTLVGMNGNQSLLAWWEFAAVAGLIILARVFFPFIIIISAPQPRIAGNAL